MSTHKYPVGAQVWATFRGVRRAEVTEQVGGGSDDPLYVVRVIGEENGYHYYESQLTPYIAQPEEPEKDQRISLFDLVEVKEREGTYSMTVTGMEVQRVVLDYGSGKQYFSPIKYSGFCSCCGSEKQVFRGGEASIRLIQRGSEQCS